MIENVGVGVSGQLVFLEAIQPLIFFSSQSTIVKEVIYQKSTGWLHFYSRDTILKILENHLTEVPILCSMVAMLRGRQSPKCGSCGQPGGIMEEKGPERKEERNKERIP